MTTVAAPLAAPATIESNKILRYGALGALGLVFISLVGMPVGMNDRTVIDPILSLGYLSLLWLPLILGWLVGKDVVLEGMAAREKSIQDVIAGATVGAISGLGLFVLALAINAFDIRDPLVNWSPQTLDILTFERSLGMAALWVVIAGALGAFGGGMHLMSEQARKATIWAILAVVGTSIFQSFVQDVVGGFEDVIDGILESEFTFRDWLIVVLVIIGFGGTLFLAPDRLRRVVLTTTGIVLGLAVVLGLIVNNVESISFLYDQNGGLTLVWAIIVAAVAFGAGWYSSGETVAQNRASFQQLSGPERTREVSTLIMLTALAMLVIPMVTGKITQELLANVGIFLLLALGLNIVVGLAGILDLGYVAFFAVGGYTTAVLTSPNRGDDWPSWVPTLDEPGGWILALLITIVFAGLTGLFIGAPVIRMRGDYLAIVTLGFGEIIRLLFLSDWLNGYFNGAQGITNIPPADFGPFEAKGTDPRSIFFLVLFFAAISIYVSWRLERSRLGRAWMAVREDESVAEAMGINTVNVKLMAFVVGAVLASFSGAIFSAKVGSIFPTSFLILVSIIILVVVIVGGMGNIIGVIVGAFVLIGVLGGPKQPGLLQEFSEYKLLIYGALLVWMMLQKPEGLVPNVRRSRELHLEEFLQDAWLKKEVDEQDAASDAADAAAAERSAEPGVAPS